MPRIFRYSRYPRASRKPWPENLPSYHGPAGWKTSPRRSKLPCSGCPRSMSRLQVSGNRFSYRHPPSADALSVSSPSQGSEPTSQAPARALSIMEPPTPYSQVVDNASSRHFFSARGEWKKSNNRLTRYGRDYRYVRPAKDVTPAWFKVRIPTAGFYTVYARWPAAKGNNPETRFQISTASGLKKVKVNQRRDGGVWMRLGAYKMNAGNRYSVQVAGRSKAEGRVVADAVMVVAGTQAAPQAGDDGAFSVGGETTMDGKAVDSEVIERART